MLFNSLLFLFFFTFVGVVYFLIPHRLRWILLLGASYSFYMSSQPGYVLLIVFLTVINYFAAIGMEKQPSRPKRKRILFFSLVSHLGLLFVFKYYDFFNESLMALFGYYRLPYSLPAFQLLLPVGISFYTFKSVSYGIDVYRGDLKPERHIGRFALYVAFFPQLLAGPIERAKRLLPQFYKRYDFDYRRVTDGLKLMLWGFFQKIVIADNLAPLVDSVFDHPTQCQGPSLMAATLLFAFQIYCDFSGYSDIAIGSAQVLGFRTMDNFDRPYFSRSIQEFWRRWHISLSTWFRDYLYIPLGGNRVSIPRRYFNILVVLMICGLWHGADWTFVLWGGIHGFYLAFSTFTQQARNRIHQAMGLTKLPRLHLCLKGLITFSLVSFAWIFFRANNASEAFYIVSHLFTGWEGLGMVAFKGSAMVGSLKFELITATTSICLLLAVHLMQGGAHLIDRLNEKPVWMRWSIYYSTVLAILLAGNFGSKEFIYFQF